MKSNIFECSNAMNKIKKKLEVGGYNIINVDTYNSLSSISNILIKPTKPVKYAVSTARSSSDIATSTASSSQKVCPFNAAATIDMVRCSCTYTGECKVNHTNCPLMNGSISGGGNTSSRNTATTNATSGDFLVRIAPTDIHNGIFLHVIILHGEHCDLKMTFGYDSNGIKNLLETIKFLIG